MNELYLFKKEYYDILHFKRNEMRNSLALLMFDNWVPSLNIPYSLYTGLLLTTLLL